MSDENKPVGVFISHTHADRALADALSRALEDLLGRGVVNVEYSSKKEEEGGVLPGEDWFQWIVTRVRAARVALVLLTPASIQKPWILWEAGAVQGVALADSGVGDRRVRPLTFALAEADIPSPFTRVQVLGGDRREDMMQFFSDLLDEMGDVLSSRRLIDAAKRLEATLETYLDAVTLALRDIPMLPTEAVVQEWCLRLDDVARAGRMSEVAQLHDWLNIAFGRERGERPRPLDFRIHRRLGSLYMGADNNEKAAAELEFARALAPRDIFILRELGRAHLQGNRLDAAEGAIRDIERLDAEAFVRNAECAALKGRWHRQRHDPEAERDVYRRASEHAPQSYYLADLLGQAELALGDREAARAAYAKALAIITRLSESNVWTHATAATAAIVIGDEPSALAHLGQVRSYDPSVDTLSSIEGGLQRVKTSLGLDDAALARWSAALRGKPI